MKTRRMHTRGRGMAAQVVRYYRDNSPLMFVLETEATIYRSTEDAAPTVRGFSDVPFKIYLQPADVRALVAEDPDLFADMVEQARAAQSKPAPSIEDRLEREHDEDHPTAARVDRENRCTPDEE